MAVKATNSSLFVTLHRLLDVILPIASILILSTANESISTLSLMPIALGAIALNSFFSQLAGVYTEWRGRSFFASTRLVLSAWTLTLLSLMSGVLLLNTPSSSDALFWVEFYFLTLILLLFYRILIRVLLGQLRSKGIGNLNAIIVGNTQAGFTLGETLIRNAWLGFDIKGYVCETTHNESGNLKHLGKLTLLKEILASESVDVVFVCLKQKELEKLDQVLALLADHPVTVKFVPDLDNYNLMHSKVEIYQGTPVISLYDSPMTSRTAKLIKRTMDISGALLALALFLL